MEDRKAVIAERVRELAESYCIRVKQVSIDHSANQEMELTFYLDLDDSERPHKVKIPITDVDDVLLFKEVELESIQGILEDCSVQKFKKDEVVLSAGESNDSIHLLLSGQLHVQLELSLQPVARLEPGELVGEISVVDGQPTTAYVVADEDSRVLVLDESTLWTLFEASPRIAHNLLFIVVQRLRRGDALIKALSLSGG